MIEFLVVVVLGIGCLILGLVDTFPDQMNSWKRIFFWVGVDFLAIPGYLFLSWALKSF